MKLLLFCFLIFPVGTLNGTPQDSISRTEVQIQQLQQTVETLRHDLEKSEQTLKELQEEKVKHYQLLYDQENSRLTNYIWTMSIIIAVLAAILTFIGREVLVKSIDGFFRKQSKKLTIEKLNIMLTEGWLRKQVEVNAERPISEAIELLKIGFEATSDEMLSNAKTAMQLHQKEAKETIDRIKKGEEELYAKRAELDSLGIAQKSGKLDESEQKKIKEYEEKLDFLKNEDKFTADDWFWKARAEDQKKEYNKAIELYTKSLKLNPNSYSAWNNRGMAKYELEKIEEAILDFDQSIKLNPNDDVAWNNRGTAKTNIGKFEEAITDLNKSVELNPKNSIAWNNRGTAKTNIGKFEEAVLDYTLSIQFDANYDTAWNNRGAIKNILGKFEEARQDLTESIRLAPKYENSYAHRAFSNLMLNNLKEAIKDNKEAMRLNPKYDRPYFNRGLIFQKQGKMKEACEAWKKALELGFKEAEDKLKEFCK